MDPAGGVHDRDVTGTEPAAREGLRRVFGPTEVPEMICGPDSSNSPASGRHLVATFVHDARLDEGQRDADRERSALGVHGGADPRGNGDDPDDVSVIPKRVVDVVTESVLELADRGRRDGRPARIQRLDRGECSADAPGARYRALKTVIEPIVNVTPCSTKASRVTSGWNRLANTSAHSRTSATTA